MDATLRARIVDLAGEGALQADGSIAPQEVDQLAHVVRALAELSTPFTIASSAGGGDDVVTISVSRMTAVEARAGSLILRAEAGATVDAVRAAAAEHELAVVGLPQPAGAERVGGLIARGLVPRRSVAGVEAVLPTGEQVRTGAAVLKDVVSYDLVALLLGSMGRLAVIAAASFRLEPAGARTPVGAPPGVTQSGSGLLARAFDPHALLRERPA
jgi:FAD/FMN-containing dehydrogenase